METTFAGAGVISGDLTPECAALVTAVLESLAAPMGAEDTRTREQRYHDGLEEAMRRLARLRPAAAAGRAAGEDVGHTSLAELRAMDDGSLLETEWITEMRIRWAAHRAEAEGGSGGDGGAWRSGDAARAVACDATITPVVTGNIDRCALDDLVRLCVEAGPPRARPGPLRSPRRLQPRRGPPRPRRGGDRNRLAIPGPLARAGPAAVPPGLLSQEAIRQAIIEKVADLLSGPGGLASFLRTRQLGARLAGRLPLDIGYAATIPPGIRNAVILRDRKCRWPGGCNQPAAACQVHHVRHKAHGGPTSLKDCVLLCSYHHQIVIHRWGWTLVLNPDGTTTARNPDRTKVLDSHGPPGG